MKPIFLVGIVLAVIFALIGVYYLIPMSTAHLFATKVNTADIKHAAVFFVLAIIAIIGGRFAANAGSATAK